MSNLNLINETTTNEAMRVYMGFYHKTRDFLHPSLGVAFTIVCILGMLANIMNIIALSAIIRKSKLPVYRCFLGLAIADFMALLFMCIFNGFKYLVKAKMVIDNTDVKENTASQPFNTIFYLLPHFINIAFAASNWCVVAMSSFRCIAVYAPLWYQQHCSTLVVNVTLVIVYLFSIFINIPSFMVTRFDKMRGLFEDETQSDFNPKTISIVVIQGLPMLITGLLVVALISKLCSHSAIERSASNAEYRNRDRLQTSVTLVCISAFFVVCVTPSVVYFTYQYYNKEKRDGSTQYKDYKVYTAVDFLLAINYTANFCFYVLLNARLRRRLTHILRCPQGKGTRRDQSHSFACVTQHSTLSGVATSELGGDQSSIGWSPGTMLNGNRKWKPVDCKDPLTELGFL
ncbi:mas-related G-protein coupled receptor member A6-like [Watersipora subatra]|uniref:mas-related G-protein coupled receptor member A6-like n=1 Tax=Watersipora subatra TaxID=2589382 RepID=UPI00355B91AF